MSQEIYVDGVNREVTLTVPVAPLAGTVVIDIFQNGVLKHSVDTLASLGNNKFSFTLPFSLTQEDAEFTVAWEFDYVENAQQQHYRRETQVTVATPYLSLDEVAKITEEDDFSTQDNIDIERAVRQVINSHTGQSFGLQTATYDVRGKNASALLLPERLVEVLSFNGVENAGQYYEVAGDGWWLKIGYRDVPPVRADYYNLHQHRGGVIHNPNNVSLDKFRENTVYSIHGRWGWKFVPPEVNEAARLLANDFASGDNIYRDRFLTSMTAADWRIQFHSGAFRQTGNVRADQLLSQFVLTRGWAVI